MNLPILISTIACLLFSSQASALDDCYSCHGQKGGRTYVSKDAMEQSVHAKLTCDKCHLGIATYPHVIVSRVNCGICHFLGREGAPQEQAAAYKLSVHGRAAGKAITSAPTCQACHGGHTIYRSADPRSLTNREKIPALCGRCHANEFAKYEKSIHGSLFLKDKVSSAPTCFDCHMEHRIPNVAEAKWKLSLIDKCGACHPEKINTYHKTYHGKVTRLGYTTIAMCWDCHGSHDILPRNDAASTLSSANLVATCKKCHPGATESFTKFYAHAEETNRAQYPVLYYTYLFMTLLLIGTFAFFLTHTFLWAYRALKERIQKKGGM
jgi:predicted CXXCH cytochrome family protein